MASVRRATPADADEIGRVHAETWRAAYTGIFPESAFNVAERRRWWREVLGGEPPQRGGGPVGVFVAEVEGEVVGFASVGAARDERDALGELYAIYVDPHRWGTGAGRALIEQAEESLRASGFAEAVLWVLEGNERAERFYRAAGWVHDGGRKVEEFQGAVLTEVRYRKRL